MAGARAVVAHRRDGQRRDRRARRSIDAYARQMTEADDGPIGEPSPAAKLPVARAADVAVLGKTSALAIDPRPKRCDCFMWGPIEVGLACECPQGAPQWSDRQMQGVEALGGTRVNATPPEAARRQESTIWLSKL